MENIVSTIASIVTIIAAIPLIPALLLYLNKINKSTKKIVIETDHLNKLIIKKRIKSIIDNSSLVKHVKIKSNKYKIPKNAGYMKDIFIDRVNQKENMIKVSLSFILSLDAKISYQNFPDLVNKIDAVINKYFELTTKNLNMDNDSNYIMLEAFATLSNNKIFSVKFPVSHTTYEHLKPDVTGALLKLTTLPNDVLLYSFLPNLMIFYSADYMRGVDHKKYISDILSPWRWSVGIS